MKVDNNVSEILMTKEKVLKLLKGVNSSKSAGADGIHPHFIKETAETLTIPVFILFNKSLSEGSLPDIFKKANVTPIPGWVVTWFLLGYTVRMFEYTVRTF